MDSWEIIDSIQSIYDRYQVPQNLRKHMRMLAATVEMICDNWTSPEVNKYEIIAAALLHDLGAIVKFDVMTYNGMNMMMGAEESALWPQMQHWQNVKRETLRKYGGHSFELDSTHKMLDEMKVNGRVSFLIKNYYKPEAHEAHPNDWAMKIMIYAEGRIGANGIIPFQERVEKMLRGASGTPREQHIKRTTDSMTRAEKEVVAKMAMSEAQINDGTIAPYLAKYAGGQRIKSAS